MPSSFKRVWAPDAGGQWHKIIAYTRWGNDGPWTTHTACHRFLTEAEMGEGSSLNPPDDARCRRCEVTEIVEGIARKREGK